MMRPWLWRYGGAILSVLAAATGRMLLSPVMGDRQPFPTFYLALILSAGYGGRGPVLLALVLGYLAAAWFFVEPHFSLAAGDPVSVAAYFFVGIAIAAYSDVMHADRDRARSSAAQAVRKQAELEQEIADRKKAEREREALLQELETARRRLEAVLQQMPAGVIIAEAPSGRFVLANDQVQEIWRQPFVAAEDFQDYAGYSGLDPDGSPYRPHQWPLARSLVMGEVVKDEEIGFRRGNGRRGTMSVSSAPIRDGEGTIIAGVVVFHDITERKQAEQELRRIREELEVRVAERTAALAEANKSLRTEVSERRVAERTRNQLLRRLVDIQEEERSRIARELHDQMGQQLTALKLGLDALDADGHDGTSRHLRVQGLLELARQVGHDMHRIAWELGPAVLDGYDLPTALSSYADEWSGHSRVPVQFHCAGEWSTRLPSQVEATVYRIVQEALTNVSKHSLATRLSLIVERREDQVLAIVEDDGIGFNVEEMASRTSPNRGLGLPGMRQRVEAVGGSIQIESSPGQGTAVFVRLPASDGVRVNDG